MLNRINKKIGIIIVCFIYIIGIGFIFIQSSMEWNRIAKEREKFYIVMDSNKKDILKIEKKYLLSSEISKIYFTKTGDDKLYTVEDKALIEDIMSKTDFGKFVFDDSSMMSSVDISMEILNSGNTINISLSTEDKLALLKYNNSTFSVVVNDDFYNFIYNLFAKIKG